MRAATNSSVLLGALCASLGCSGKHVEIVLEPQGGCESPCGLAPLHCVESLRLGQHGEHGPVSEDSAMVGPSDGNTNLCANGFAAALDVEIGAATGHLEVWGFAAGSPVSPHDPPPLFVARGGYERESSEGVHLEARCVLSCEAAHPYSHEMVVVDLLSGDVPAEVETIEVTVGMVYDMRAFYPEQPELEPRTATFAVAAVGPGAVDGRVELDGEVFEWTGEGENHCWAVRLLSESGGPQLSCTEPHELVVHVLAGDRRDAVWGWLERITGHPPGEGFFVGVVRSAATDDPVEGAHVSGLPAADVFYPGFEFAWSPEAPVLAATGPQGVFVARGPYIGELVVERNGVEQSLRVAAVPDHVGARLIHLPPAE